MLSAARLQYDMDDLKDRLRLSLENTPDDYDGREAMWMAREDLREERDA